MLTQPMADALTSASARGGPVETDDVTVRKLVREGLVIRHPTGVFALTGKGIKIRYLLLMYGTERMAKYYL